MYNNVNANNNNDNHINNNNNNNNNNNDNNNSNRFINKLIYNDIKVSCHQYYYFTWNEESWLGARCRDLSTKMIENNDVQDGELVMTTLLTAFQIQRM